MRRNDRNRNSITAILQRWEREVYGPEESRFARAATWCWGRASDLLATVTRRRRSFRKPARSRTRGAR